MDVQAGISRFAAPDDRGYTDPRAILVEDKRGLKQGLLLGVGAANRGRRPIQVTSAYFSHGKIEYQVRPPQFPAVLEPNTRIDVTLQLEWIDGMDEVLVDMGLLDALGRKHPLKTELRESLALEVSKIQLRTARYRRRDGADERLDREVAAFQVFDNAVMISQRTADAKANH